MPDRCYDRQERPTTQNGSFLPEKYSSTDERDTEPPDLKMKWHAISHPKNLRIWSPYKILHQDVTGKNVSGRKKEKIGYSVP